MNIARLREKLLLGAIAVSAVVALASMLGVSWVIRQQNLEQSRAVLQKAADLIDESLEDRKEDLLGASRQLAAQKNLGSTLWYLSQYAQSTVDSETLFNTYVQLERDATRITRAADAARVALYNGAGKLVSLAVFEGNAKQVVFVERFNPPVLQTASLKAGEDLSRSRLRRATIVAGIDLEFGGPLPQREEVRYAVWNGQLAIESLTPVMGVAFDPHTGKAETRQLGLVVMVRPLGQAFAEHLAALTGTRINLYTPAGYGSGSLPAYRSPDWSGAQVPGAQSAPPISNEVTVAGEDYYQSLMPLYAGGQSAGTIAALYSKENARESTRRMLLTLAAIAAASLLLILPFAWYFAVSISRPLTVLSRAFRGVADGRQAPGGLGELRAGPMRQDELGDLTHSFIAMHDAVGQKIQQINDLNASLEQKVRERTAALAASETESRTLIENSPDTIARYDRDCRRLYVNPAFAAVAEGGVAALLGTKPSESPGGANMALYESKIREAFATGQNTQFELKWSGKDGRELCSHIRLTPEFDASGAVSTVMGVGRDITELNQSRNELALAAEALRGKDDLLEESQAIAMLGSYTLDIRSLTWAGSKGLDKIFGIDASYEHSAEQWFALVHPEDRQRVRDYIKGEVLGQGRPFNLEYRVTRRSDGAVRWMHGLGRVEQDAGGHAIRVHGTVQDITVRKQAEQQLNDLLAFNRTILESSPSGIAVYREDGPCIMANEAFARTVGGTRTEVLGQNFFETESWRRDGLLRFASQALATERTIQQDIEGTSSFGKRVTLSCIFAPVAIAGCQYLMVITNDISERKAAEHALTESMRQLEEKELAKTRFLAAAGHDLRQPLAAANLFIDALRFSGPNSDQSRIIQRLQQAMVTFNGLLDALLNISKLDAGIIKPEPAAIEVSELMNWMEQNFAALAVNKNLGFRLYFPLRQPLAVHSDVGLVKSVLMNLVSNAIKFTASGAILVSARRRGNQVLFQVWDSGMGMGQEHLARIFDEFYQIDNPQRDRSGGLGLGLSIAKRALLLLGEKITCRSQPGQGSVFSFCLPLHEAVSGTGQQAADEDGDSDDAAGFVAGRRIVLVEDDKLVSQAMLHMLEGLGAEVRCFYRAEDALAHAQVEHADCYIVDYMLGGAVNGTQFLAQIRQRRGAPMVAVLVTGDTSSATLRHADELEWPVLHKPVNAAQLIAALRRQAP